MTENTITTANDNKTDEEKLQEFIDLISDNEFSINTGFVADEKTGIYTHQVMQIACGEYVTFSQPEPLAVPLMPAPLAETGVTIN